MIYITSWNEDEVIEIGKEFHSHSFHHSNQKGHAEAYALFQYALNMQYGINEMPLLRYGEHGKPYLQNMEHIHFNLSHCKGMAVCGIAGSELGVDVDRVRPVREALIRKVLNEQEQEQVFQSDNIEHAFMRFWTLKESYIKAIGKGLSYPLKNISFQLPVVKDGIIMSNQEEFIFFQAFPKSNYILSVCGRKKDVKLDSNFFKTFITNYTQILSIL